MATSSRTSRSTRPSSSSSAPANMMLLDDGNVGGDDEVFFVASGSPLTAKSCKSAGGTPSPGRLSPRRLWPMARSKSQGKVSAGTGTPPCSWNPQRDRQWINRGCRQVLLPETELAKLTEPERTALKQLALVKLQALNLGINIVLPKEKSCSEHKPKKRAILLKKRAVTTGFFSTEKKVKGQDDDKRTSGQVFGVPLAMCCRHECGTSSHQTPRTRSVELNLSPTIGRSSSQGSFTDYADSKDDGDGLEDPSFDSPSNGNGKQRSFTDILSDSWDHVTVSTPCAQVPEIVSSCFAHVENYGLRTLGIFRVSSSRKRVRQLREDFDTGQPVQLGSEHCPHDVATLLKEYFRDLPEPLLTRELYPAFLVTQKICNRKHELEALQYLIHLLPFPNCDTLIALLQFLSRVAKHSADGVSATGRWLSGNKMDSTNLATLFGPNILHTVKGGSTRVEREYVVLTASRADERIDVINAVRTMIDNVTTLSRVSSENLHETYLFLLDRKPEVVEQLLNMRSGVSEIDVDLDTSSSLIEGIDLATPPNERNAGNSDEVFSNNEPTSDRGSKKSVASRLFRRREKSATPPVEGKIGQRNRVGSSDETGSGSTSMTRWFRRKVKDSTIDDLGRRRSDCQVRLTREASPASQVRPLSIQQRLSVPDINGLPSTNRRSSSSDIPHDSSVVSASFTLRVPISTLALRMDDRDIPFVDAVSTLELRDDVDGQRQPSPFCGRKKPYDSRDSVLSSEGGSSLSGDQGGIDAGASPRNLRHTPSSDMGCASASGASTPLSSSSPPPPSLTWQATRSVPASPRVSPRTSPDARRNREGKWNNGGRGTKPQENWAQGTATTWKRWEIIASDHTGGV